VSTSATVNWFEEFEFLPVFVTFWCPL